MLAKWDSLNAANKRIIVLISLVMLAAYGLIIAYSASTMYSNRALSTLKHIARLSPTATEPGRTPPDPLPETGEHVTVKIGTYVDGIDNMSIKDSAWNVSFYLWFSWKGDAKLDPGGKAQIIDGVISKKDLLEQYSDAGGTNYQRYKINAKIIKYFDTSRIPVEDHMLNIYIEDGARDGTKLRYVTDEASNISSRVNIPAFKIFNHATVVKTHTYKSTYGDPRLGVEDKKVFSQHITAIQIKRIDLGFFIKIFLALYAGLLLTLCSFFVKASDVGPRFSMPSAAYFGAVANSYMANGLLPSSGAFGLIDHVAGVGLFTIFASIALSLLSNFYMRKEEKDLSITLDRCMLWVVGVGCLVANVVIPWCALG
jgi:hypothetical protein